VPDALSRIPGVTIKVEKLDCGDYVIGDAVLGVERKRTEDFVNSILDGRLVEQVARLVKDFPIGVILIEGDIYATRSGIALEAIDGALSWLALLSGLQVLHTPDTSRSAGLIHRMALHTIHGLGYEVPLRSAKPKDLGTAAQFLLEGLPGCGPTTAQKLLRHFGSARAALYASDDELRKVPGVGPKLISGIREVLNHEVR